MFLYLFFGREINGALRWIILPGLGSLQPSEFTKIGMVVFFAAHLTLHKDSLRNVFKGFFRPFLLLGPPIAVLFLVQDHLSASIIIIGVTSIMMIMAGTRIAHFVTFGAAGLRKFDCTECILLRLLQELERLGLLE